MATGRYLRRRGYTWFFRLRWPAALAACRVSGELIVSLGTGDYRLALQRARLLRLQAEYIMARFTPTTTKTEAETAVRGWIDRCLWRQEAHCAETGGIALLDTAEIETMGRQDAAELDALLQFAGRKHVGDERAKVARALGASGPGLEAYAGIIDAAGRDIGVPIDRATTDGRLLARTVLRGYSTLLQELTEAVADIPRQAQAAVAKPALPTFLFFAHWDEFTATKISNKAWKKDTADNAQATPKLFQDLIDKLPFNKIDGDVVGQFRRKFLELPCNYHTKKDWKDLRPSKVLDAIKKLDEAAQKQIRRTTNTTANKHVMALVEYWEHLAKTEKIPADLKNPCRGHLTTRPRGRAAREEHPMWPANEERRLFTSPMIMGCKSIYRRAMPGEEIHRDATFWVTFMGRTMGLREDEACDRSVGDIQSIETENGPLPYLKVRDSKTPSSSRDVPIPAQLLDMGFLEYRYYGRQPDEPLFPELIPQGAESRRSPAYGGRFVYYRQKIHVYDPQYDFRSFRGNVSTQLRNLEGVNTGWVDEILGHESPVRRSEGARYTKAIFLTRLRDALDRVTIGVDPYNPSTTPPVDFSHLYYNGTRGVPAPGAADAMKEYVRLAELEMRKKAGRPHKS
jgi:hypothetical protein